MGAEGDAFVGRRSHNVGVAIHGKGGVLREDRGPICRKGGVSREEKSHGTVYSEFAGIGRVLKNIAKKKAGMRRRGKGRVKVVDGLNSAEPAAREVIPTEMVGFPVLTKGITLHWRPGFDQVGVKCIVKANHFLTQLPDKDLSQYDEDYGRAVKTEIGMKLLAYAKRKSFYTAGILPFSFKEFNADLSVEDEGTEIPRWGLRGMETGVERDAIL